MTTAYSNGLPMQIESDAVRFYPASGAEFVDTTNRVAVVENGQFGYEAVAAGQSDQILGATGGVGDYLDHLVITVGTAASAATSIKDGNGSAIPILPNSPGGGIGVYIVPINAVCVNATTPGWKVTTGAGSTVLAVGRFTA